MEHLMCCACLDNPSCWRESASPEPHWAIMIGEGGVSVCRTDRREKHFTKCLCLHISNYQAWLHSTITWEQRLENNEIPGSQQRRPRNQLAYSRRVLLIMHNQGCQALPSRQQYFLGCGQWRMMCILFCDHCLTCYSNQKPVKIQ